MRKCKCAACGVNITDNGTPEARQIGVSSEVSGVPVSQWSCGASECTDAVYSEVERLRELIPACVRFEEFDRKRKSSKRKSMKLRFYDAIVERNDRFRAA